MAVKDDAFRRAFRTLATGGILAKAIGILREVIFAAAFGTGNVATGFRVSVTASLTPSNLIISDVVSSGFAPTYSRCVKRSPTDAATILRAYAVWVTLALAFVAAGVYFFREPIVGVIVPGSPSAVRRQSEEFLAVLAWTIPLFGLSQVFSYALSAVGIHWGNGLRPALQSVGLLIGTGAAVITGEPLWLAYGFIAAWTGYVLVCAVRLRILGSFGASSLSDLTQGWRLLAGGFRAVVPLLLLGLVVQLSIVAERAISSQGPANLVAATDYARMISDTAILVVATPLGVLGLTHLPQLSRSEAARTVDKMMGLVFLLTIPFAIITTVAAEPIIGAVFQRGSFGTADVEVTATVLVGLCLALLPQAVVYVLTRALAGAGRNIPVLIWCGLGLVLQVCVQGVLIARVGPIAIGLGIALNAALVAVALSREAQAGRALARQLILWLPAILCAIAAFEFVSSEAWRLIMTMPIVALNSLLAIRSNRASHLDVTDTRTGPLGEDVI